MTVSFRSQVGGTYDGMPLFDGDPGHLGTYLDSLVAYAGIEASANWANGIRGDFTIPSGPDAGKVVPGAPQFDEGLQGFSTDFPTPLAMAQSWNTELLRGIGQVIGTEKLYGQSFRTSISGFNPMVSAALLDIRPNPLSGRLDEGFGEDPVLASAMVEVMSRGISGIDAAGNDRGFWTKAMVDTKHFTNYAAQWFRIPGHTDVSARAEKEYWSVPALKGVASGAIGAVLTTYGRTNGIPNSISPMISYVQSLSPWGGLYSTPDNGAELQLHAAGSYGNGFDTQYAPTWADGAALFVIANAGSIAATGNTRSLNAGLIRCAETGTYGLRTDDIVALARTQILPLVRMGLFNERDAAGYPKGYPFLNLSSVSPTPLDHTDPDHQAIALAAAQQSIVLLKNIDGVLPLRRDASLAVVGPVSDARFRTTRAVAAPSLPHSGLTPVQGIRAVAAEAGTVFSATDGEIVVFRSVATGRYLAHGTEPAPSVAASAAGPAAATSFEAFAWGQGAYGYRSSANNLWLRFASNAVDVGGTARFGTNDTAIPYRWRRQDNQDGTVSFLAETYSESFDGGFETTYYTHGRFLTVDDDGSVGVTALLTDDATAAALNTTATRFWTEAVRPAGTQAATALREHAVVVLGAPPRHSSGEGADRSDLNLGADQYRLAENVAATYPGRTIVVLTSTAPVIVDSLHRNENIAAIVSTPYAGQYGAYALGQVLFGDYAPTGRLNQTWYADQEALPALDDYSIPEGTDARISRAGLDPRFTVDMTNADPVVTGLTYAYTDARVTYEFGYGLSYSTFGYSRLRVEPTRGGYAATVEVTNTGTVETSEVVQLYATGTAPAYARAAPKRQLVGFRKVAIAPGRSVPVQIPFDPSALALWNTRTGRLEVESGGYEFQAGRSSTDIRVRTTVRLPGETFGPTDATSRPLNVYDHSFAGSNLTYRETSKQNTVTGLAADRTVHGYHVVMSRGRGAWTAINQVGFRSPGQATVSVASTRASSGIELRLDQPRGRLIGRATFGDTGVSSYTIPGTTPAGDIPVREIGYREITIGLESAVSGSHDLYIVFGDRDIRIRDIQFSSRRA